VPSGIEGFVGVTSTETRTALETLSLVDPILPARLAVIVVSPRASDCAKKLKRWKKLQSLYQMKSSCILTI
jgi:hypothetical protein